MCKNCGNRIYNGFKAHILEMYTIHELVNQLDYMIGGRKFPENNNVILTVASELASGGGDFHVYDEDILNFVQNLGKLGDVQNDTISGVPAFDYYVKKCTVVMRDLYDKYYSGKDKLIGGYKDAESGAYFVKAHDGYNYCIKLNTGLAWLDVYFINAENDNEAFEELGTFIRRNKTSIVYNDNDDTDGLHYIDRLGYVDISSFDTI